MLKGGHVLIWELDINLVLTLLLRNFSLLSKKSLWFGNLKMNCKKMSFLGMNYPEIVWYTRVTIICTCCRESLDPP